MKVANKMTVQTCSFKLKGNLQSECASRIGNSDQKSEMNSISELQNMELRQQLLHTKITRESFECNDRKVQYMTGLPSFMTLIAVFGIIEPHMSEGVMSSLSKFNKFMLVLTKLKPSTPVQDFFYFYYTCYV